MTSKWTRSAPAATTASTSAPRRAKSAERIDGAIQWSAIVHPHAPNAATIISRARARLTRVHRSLRAQRRRQCERERACGREHAERLAIAGELACLRAGEQSDEPGARDLPQAEHDREQALPRPAALLAGLAQHDVAQRRAEQSREPEPDRHAGGEEDGLRERQRRE